jgi:hypothetical protein
MLPDISISLSVDNKPFETCLEEISARTDLYIAYKSSLIDTIFIRSFHCSSLQVGRLFDTLFSAYGLSYHYMNRQVFLRKIPSTLNFNGQILNVADSTPISYASISVKGTPTGTITDFKGIYEWEVSSNYTNDTIIISSMGFKKKFMVLSQLKNYTNNFILLEPALFEIEPVEVRKPEYHRQQLGNMGNRAIGSIYIDTHGQQTGLLVENDRGQYGKLIEVSFFLSADGNTSAPYRVRIYDIDSISGLPNRDIIDEILVAKPSGSDGWHTIDISAYNIAFESQGVFVALEGIFPNDYEYYSGNDEFIEISNKNINSPVEDLQPGTVSYGQRLGFNRKKAENTWHYSLSHIWFQLRKQNYGVMIRATVQFEKIKKSKKERKYE